MLAVICYRFFDSFFAIVSVYVFSYYEIMRLFQTLEKLKKLLCFPQCNIRPRKELVFEKLSEL